MKRLTKSQLAQWDNFRKNISTATAEVLVENKAQRAARMQRLADDYDAFCMHYFPHWCDAPCAEYHKEIAYNLLQNPKITQFNIIYRGGAKSVHANLLIPIWLCFFHRQLNFMLLVGENEDKASILLRDIQDNLELNHRLIADFGEQMQYGSWADGEFKIKNGAFFKAIGINQSARGLRNGQHRPDYISVDDVEDRKKANNKTIVVERVNKIMGDMAGSFSKDYERLVISNNLIHRSGVVASLLEAYKGKPATRITWRNALDDNGKPTWDRFTSEHWRNKQANYTYAEFQREFMNNPVEEGRIFKNDWITYAPMYLSEYKKLICYGDLSYKESGDYKALVLLGKKDNEFHVLKAFVEHTSLQQVIQWCYDLHHQTPTQVALSFHIEANFIQDMFIEAFVAEGKKRGYYLNVQGDKRQKPDKFMRIEALTPIFERGLIRFNEYEKNTIGFQRLIEQLLVFEKGSSANDDAPDALEGAVFLLNKETSSIFNATPTFFQKVRKNIF